MRRFVSYRKDGEGLYRPSWAGKTMEAEDGPATNTAATDEEKKKAAERRAAEVKAISEYTAPWSRNRPAGPAVDQQAPAPVPTAELTSPTEKKAEATGRAQKRGPMPVERVTTQAKSYPDVMPSETVAAYKARLVKMGGGPWDVQSFIASEAGRKLIALSDLRTTYPDFALILEPMLPDSEASRLTAPEAPDVKTPDAEKKSPVQSELPKPQPRGAAVSGLSTLRS
jgi:hypothetical protein